MKQVHLAGFLVVRTAVRLFLDCHNRELSSRNIPRSCRQQLWQAARLLLASSEGPTLSECAVGRKAVIS